MRGQPVSRMPSYLLVQERLKDLSQLNVSRCFYVLNPGGDLVRTQSKFEKLLQAPVFSGQAGVEPSTERMKEGLHASELFL
jgi:separase